MYQIEASEKPEPEKAILGKQLGLMTKRLWTIITWPSMILATFFGLVMFYLNPILFKLPWMQIKLGFVAVLILYHIINHSIFKQLQKGEIKYSSRFMRIWNEVATLILFAVIFLVITKSAVNWMYGLAGLILLGLTLMMGIKLYKSIQQKNPDA